MNEASDANFRSLYRGHEANHGKGAGLAGECFLVFLLNNC